MTNQTKRQYRIRNWAQYNSALVRRGSLTLWLDVHSVDTWLNVEPAARRGRSRTYTDAAILCALMLREVYHLPLRATEGQTASLIHLLKVNLPAPDYSTLSRRARSLQLSLGAQRQQQIKHWSLTQPDSSSMAKANGGSDSSDLCNNAPLHHWNPAQATPL